jgi:peptidoglycan hydrolase-like protein with peptidoglycan-binding domain
MKKYFVCGVLMAALTVPLAVYAQSADLETMTQSLLKQVESLRQQINQLQTQLTQVEQQVQEIIRFTKTLRKGAANEEVTRLQEFLKTDPQVYPEGLVTGYFGTITEKAVKKFQEKHAGDILKPLGLSQGTGVVGTKTIEKMNEVLEEAGKSGNVPPGLLKTAQATQETTQATVVEPKTVICHIPDGNAANKQTIVIDGSALNAHLAHGDTRGACPTAPALITLLNPNGGEWKIGGTYEIHWSQTQNAAVTITLQNKQLVEGYSPWYKTVVTSIMGKAGENGYYWTVPAGLNPHRGYEVCVAGSFDTTSAGSVSEDCSDPTLYISGSDSTTQYSLTVVSPNGGETWAAGSSQYIKWTSTIPASHNIITVRLRNSARAEYNLLSNTPNDGMEQIVVPATLAAGTYILEIKTAYENQTVSDASDATFTITNQTPTPVPVPTPAPTSLYLPDIEPTTLSIGSIYASESNWIGAGFRNVGTAVLSQNFVIKYYVNGSFVCEQERIVSGFAPITSGGGTSGSKSCNYIFPAPGNYEIKAVLDANSTVSEVNEGNNAIVRTVNIVAPPLTLADLYISYVYLNHYNANLANYISVNIVNYGGAVAPKGFIIRFYVDGNYVGENLQSSDVPSGAGTASTLNYTFTSAGPHEVKVIVDPANLVTESSDENNALTETITVR